MYRKRCIQVWLLMQVFSNAFHMSDTEVVYPKRHTKERMQNDFGTLNQQGTHEDYVTYEIKSKKDHYFLDLEKIKKPLQDFIWLRSIENGKEVAVKHYPENCYYEGKVRGKVDSKVSISTCSGGLTGTIYFGNEQYEIMPHEDKSKHAYRNVENKVKKIKKQLRDWDSAVNDKGKGEKLQMQTKTSTLLSDFKAPPHLFNIEPQYLPYTRNETLYVEIFVTCDYRMLPAYNNKRDLLIERVLHSYAELDKIYQAINVRIVVVAIDIHEKIPLFTLYEDVNKAIDSYVEYVNNVILKKSPFKDVIFDHAMFLSHTDWVAFAGKASGNNVCASDSSSVNHWVYDDINGPVITLAHELGHSMGFTHDEVCIKPWKCLSTRGCFMSKIRSSRAGFSDCSMKVFKVTEYGCLYNYPSMSLTKVCGNGIREGDEQCDCGTLEMCRSIGENCCVPNNCVLKASAQCSSKTNPECCQPSCLYKRQGTLCRMANGECDLPEYCEGNKATCPENKFVRNGASCWKSTKFFFGPTDDSSSVVSKLLPPITSQYLRIVSKQWGVNDHPCFKFDLLGCNEKDCDISLLVGLPDSAYTANSSGYRSLFETKNVKISDNGWCSKVKAEGWFQVNFGKKVKIATVVMQGTYYGATTGYNLQYSDDGLSWFDYLESDADELKKLKSLCFSGTCQPTLTEQCRMLWESDALVASDSCWNNLNTNKNGYGTCQSNQNTPCDLSNVKCGQLQCNAKQLIPPRNPNYGKNYKQLTYDNQKCSGASITESDQGSLGMVLDGTMCAENKFCVNSKCNSAEEHGFKICPKLNGKECSGNGVCSSDGICVCNLGYSQADNCLTKFNPINGQWSQWSDYTKCSKACNGGVQERYRFCSNPIPQYGGFGCDGLSIEDKKCNQLPCPVAESCLDLKKLLESQGLPLYDGQYTVKPNGSPPLEVYCDMTRNGGGWTLIVSSHTNTWDEKNVWERNVDKPDLYNDYSIFKYADKLVKGNSKVKEINYRLEADEFGRWGGVFSAPGSYDLSSSNSQQAMVKLLEKFDDWDFGLFSLGQRVPYVSDHYITTSEDPTLAIPDMPIYGSLTEKEGATSPIFWISGLLKMETPNHAWYWVRKGDS